MFKIILIGLISGAISGFFGAGGGLIVVPCLIHILKFDERIARATSIFVILPLVITSAVFYTKNSYMDWNLGINIILGGSIGGYIGSKLLTKLPEMLIRISFIMFAIFVSVRMILS